MTSPTRKLVLIVAAVVCLVLAGAAGAIVRYTVFTITPGNFANVSGTGLYCQSLVTYKGHRAFLCQSQPGPGIHVLKGTYDFVVDKNGVTVQRSTSGQTGATAIVRAFVNP